MRGLRFIGLPCLARSPCFCLGVVLNDRGDTIDRLGDDRLGRTLCLPVDVRLGCVLDDRVAVANDCHRLLARYRDASRRYAWSLHSF